MPSAAPSGAPIPIVDVSVSPSPPTTVSAPTAPAPTTTSGTLSACETAFARCSNPDQFLCFNNDLDPSIGSFERWGWTNKVLSLDLTCDIYAGAAQCDLTKGVKVGTVIFSANSVVVQLDVGVESSDMQFYSGVEQVPKSNADKYTVSPGQYPLVVDAVTSYTLTLDSSLTIDVNDYVILHTTVCPATGF
jgi:hypothetical protein